jgi:hypothetical protein
MLVFAVSAACLHAAASVPLVCGFAAKSFQDLRHASKEDLKAACADAGTLPVTHASYLARKLSQSSMPILSALAVEVLVEVVVVVVVVPEFVVLVVVVLVVAVLSEPPHANRNTPSKRHRAKIRDSFVVIGQFSLLQEVEMRWS